MVPVSAAMSKAIMEVLFALSITSTLYFVLTVVASVAVWRRPPSSSGPRPQVSILVPLCGVQPSLRANLEILRAGLGAGDDLLVGAGRSDDPALDVAHEVLAGDGRARIVAGTGSGAANPKVAMLSTLESLATRDVVVLVDADVRLSGDLLDGLVRAAGEAGTGLATALYRGVPSDSIASRLEALTINMEFVPSVLVARLLGGGIDFALGAANAVRREALDAIGGIGSLGEMLADDHELGRRVSRAGYRITIAPVCVPIYLDSSLRDTVTRLLRWCRTYRVCAPTGYAATALSHHGVTCAVAGVGLAALEGRWGEPAAALLAGVLAVRMLTGFIGHRLIAGRNVDLRSLPLLGLRDLMGSGLFLSAWLGSGVTWRGARFRVQRDGRLHRESPGLSVVASGKGV